ncbi:MAG: hypothetical protein Q9163_005299 [Psora crenata]
MLKCQQVSTATTSLVEEMPAVNRLALDIQKPIILTFDAFGTLFTPRKPIERLYSETARRHGLTGFTEEDIGRRFREGGPTRPHLAHGQVTDERVITNSDDRVRDILSSLGIDTTRAGYNWRKSDAQSNNVNTDSGIDFLTMSYDTGTEKPSCGIFQAAAELSGMEKLEGVQCIHVGDELVADYHGALKAGWQGVLIKRDEERVRLNDLRVGREEAMTRAGETIAPGMDIPCIRSLWELKELFGLSRIS